MDIILAACEDLTTCAGELLVADYPELFKEASRVCTQRHLPMPRYGEGSQYVCIFWHAFIPRDAHTVTSINFKVVSGSLDFLIHGCTDLCIPRFLDSQTSSLSGVSDFRITGFPNSFWIPGYLDTTICRFLDFQIPMS